MDQLRTFPPRAIHALFWLSLTVYLAVLHVDHVIAIRNLAFFLMLAAATSWLIKSKQKPVFPFWFPWFIYTVVALISVTYSVSPDYSLRNIQAELGYGALILVVSASWSRWTPAISGLLIVLMAVNSLFELSTYSAASFGDPIAKIQYLPLFANAGVNSNFLVSVLPFMAFAAWWFWKKKQFWLAFIPLAIIAVDLGALVLSYNRQGFVAVLVSIVCVTVVALRYHFSWRRLAILTCLIGLVCAMLSFQFTRRNIARQATEQQAASTVTDDIRWPLWKFSLDKIEKKPWSGSGFGRETFGQLYPDAFQINPTLWHAHNMVINKGVQMGIPGMAAFLLLWFAIIRELVRHLGTSGARHALAITALSVVGAVFMKNMTDDHFLRDPAFLFWLLIGMSVGSLRRMENEETLAEHAESPVPD